MTATDGDGLALGLSRGEEDKFHLWEKGLPSAEELVPLNQSLISPVLAQAFSIKELSPAPKPPKDPATAAQVRWHGEDTCRRSVGTHARCVRLQGAHAPRGRASGGGSGGARLLIFTGEAQHRLPFLNHGRLPLASRTARLACC